MSEYNLDDIFEDVVITLDDHKFRLRERTKAQAPKLMAQQEKLDALADDAPDDVAIPVVIEAIDLLLEPLGDGRENGTRTHAKTLLTKSYEANKVGADRLFSLMWFLQTKQQDRLDPTSVPSSSSSSM